MEHKKWFEEWFNSPYYHILYANRSEEEAEKFIKKIVEKLSIPSAANVLDAACGKGRHSRTLAKLGLNVTGIDLSPNSITYAKQFENDHLKFKVWDIREKYKAAEFEYIFNLFSSFGYFDDDNDDLKVIKAFYDDLRPGGILILDYLNSECVVKNFKSRDIVPRGEIQFHIQKKLEKGFIKKRIEFLANGEHYSFEEQLKLINLYKFKEMLNCAGFQLLHTFGDYDLSEFVSSSSQRLILIAQKQVNKNQLND